MKSIPIVALTAHILSLASADFSKNEVQQRAINVLNARKDSHNDALFGRELISNECINNQIEVEATGINSLDTEDDDLWNLCDIGITDSGILEVECNYSDAGVSIDSDECTRQGGRVVKASLESECDDLIYHFNDMPTCLHGTCDAGDYSDYVEKGLDTAQITDDVAESCSYDYSITYDPGFEAPAQTPNKCTPACTVHTKELNCVDAGCVWFANSFFGMDFDICLSCENIPNELICRSKGCLWTEGECETLEVTNDFLFN